jgi:serine/threonine protein kinase
MDIELENMSTCSALSITKLRKICQSMGLSTAGKKTALCKRIMSERAHLGLVRPELVGSGSYGCVYSPPIKCETPCTDKRCKNGVSKWMSQEKADNELLEYDNLELEEVDPEGMYHIRKPIQCKPNQEELAKVEDCSAVNDYDDSSLLIYDNGGIDLEKYISQGATLKQVLIGLKNIFKGVMVMNEQNRYHFDIKTPNIVVKDGIFRLIDFGLSKNVNKTGGIIYNDVFQNIYFAWGPEVYLLGLKNSSSVSPHHWISRAYKYMENKSISDITNQYYALNKFTVANVAKVLLDISMMSKKRQYETAIKWVDVYGMGTLLGYIAKYRYCDHSQWNKHVSTSTGEPYWINTKLGKSVWRLPTDGGVVHTQLVDFISTSHMLHPDPHARPTPRQLYDMYVRFVDTL